MAIIKSLFCNVRFHWDSCVVVVENRLNRLWWSWWNVWWSYCILLFIATRIRSVKIGLCPLILLLRLLILLLILLLGGLRKVIIFSHFLFNRWQMANWRRRLKFVARILHKIFWENRIFHCSFTEVLIHKSWRLFPKSWLLFFFDEELLFFIMLIEGASCLQNFFLLLLESFFSTKY